MINIIKNIWYLAYDNIVEVALAASILMLGGAYGFEYIGGLFPCDLCWPQRYAHMAVIIFASFALFLRKSSHVQWIRFKAMTTFSYLVSVGYSGYHAGVEQKWWEGPDSCTLQTNGETLSADQFFQQLQNVNFVRCDDIPWELFGVSMAGYNFIISLVLFVMLSFSLSQDLKK